MNFKTKAIGLVAGSALALSLATGVMADTGTSSATLDPNTAANGCAFEAGNTLDANFGTYEFDGTGYQPIQNAGTVNLTINMTQDFQPTHDCAITVESTTALTSGGNTISNGNITVSADFPGTGTGTLDSARTLTFPIAATGTGAGVTLTLTTPGSTQPTGSYTGVITFTAPTGL